MTEIIGEEARGLARNSNEVGRQEKKTHDASWQAERVSLQEFACLDAKALAKAAIPRDRKVSKKPVSFHGAKISTKVVTLHDVKASAKLVTLHDAQASAKPVTLHDAQASSKPATSHDGKAPAISAAPDDAKASAKSTISLNSETATVAVIGSGGSASRKASRPRVVRGVWAGCGFLAFGLGALGAVIPLLPTIPFLMAATFCFARSSERLDVWFRSTTLYRKVLAGYVARRAMTLRSKFLLLVPVTVLLGISFALMANVPAGRVAVAVIWAAHLVYFGFVVKTSRSCEASRAGGGAVSPQRVVTEAESGR